MALFKEAVPARSDQQSCPPHGSVRGRPPLPLDEFARAAHCLRPAGHRRVLQQPGQRNRYLSGPASRRYFRSTGAIREASYFCCDGNNLLAPPPRTPAPNGLKPSA
jgi:hypothetical protein